jgi:hypothetical protein
MLKHWFEAGTKIFRSQTRPMKATQTNYSLPALDLEMAGRAFETFTFACG